MATRPPSAPNCPICRRLVNSTLLELDENHWALRDDLDPNHELDFGVWTHGRSYFRSSNPEDRRYSRLPKINRRLARRLASPEPLRLCWYECHRVQIRRHMEQYCTLVGHYSDEDQNDGAHDWLQQRIRDDTSCEVTPVDPYLVDSGWRYLTYRDKEWSTIIECLARVSPERRGIEDETYEAYYARHQMNEGQDVGSIMTWSLQCPNPLWALQDYDEVHIIRYENPAESGICDDKINEDECIVGGARSCRRLLGKLENDALALLRVFEGEMGPWDLPFNRNTDWFISKAEEDWFALLRVFEGTMVPSMLPANTDTDWFRNEAEDDFLALLRVFEGEMEASDLPTYVAGRAKHLLRRNATVARGLIPGSQSTNNIGEPYWTDVEDDSLALLRDFEGAMQTENLPANTAEDRYYAEIDLAGFFSGSDDDA